jgi:hypothetical protein
MDAQTMTKRQALKILFKHCFDRRPYRKSTLDRMRSALRRAGRGERRKARWSTAKLTPEQRLHFSLIRIPAV